MSARRVIAGSIAVIFGLGVVGAALSPFLLRDGDDTSLAQTTAATSISAPELPDLTLSDLDGQPVALRSLTGQPLVINFWYSTCPPCNAELPAFAGVATDLAGRVRFVGINPQDSAPVARQYAADRGVTYEQLLDKTQRSVDAFRLTGFPTTALVTGDGHVALLHRNELSAGELRSLIDQYLLA